MRTAMVGKGSAGAKMEPDFWHERWESNQIGFHEGETNEMLLAHHGVLALTPGARVFLPLCGKTRDIAWFLSRGSRVAGAELSRLAVEQLFAELGAVPEVAAAGELVRFSAEGIDVFVGDIFGLSQGMIGPVDAIYDRAALVALPEGMRTRYAPHLHEITGGAQQLLICFEYDQSLMAGPPFSVDGAEVARLYGGLYGITLVDTGDLRGGVRGTQALERVWALR
ncbi:MAG: thiopurine S-methyltransferase [Rhodobacterales bacterium]|nr:thiopurine S-methyltransferase [Rhodobacterales bacterium]